MPEPPTHCRHCGRELIFRIEQDGFLQNGTPDVEPVWRCPKSLGKHWFSLGLTLHEEYAPDHFIDWFWRKREYR